MSKGGSPTKNVYEVMRLQRCYLYLKDERCYGVSDGKIAGRISEVLEVCFDGDSADEGNIRHWLGDIRQGERARIRSINKLWTLFLACDPAYDKKIYDKKIRDSNIILDEEMVNRAMSLFHYSFSSDFLTLEKFIEQREKTISRRGVGIYSLLFNSMKKWICPLVDHFEVRDIAIDISEICDLDFDVSLSIARDIDESFKEFIGIGHKAVHLVLMCKLHEWLDSRRIREENLANKILYIMFAVRAGKLWIDDSLHSWWKKEVIPKQ